MRPFFDGSAPAPLTSFTSKKMLAAANPVTIQTNASKITALVS
jgi:hypothetical protein